MGRAVPPDDISPHDFFTRWVPEAVAEDEERRRRLGDTDAVIVFEIDGAGGGPFTLRIGPGGRVRGTPGASEEPDLAVRVDEETWRRLNRGEISAPHAVLKRRLRLHGDLLLGLKLHLILGGQ